MTLTGNVSINKFHHHHRCIAINLGIKFYKFGRSFTQSFKGLKNDDNLAELKRWVSHRSTLKTLPELESGWRIMIFTLV